MALMETKTEKNLWNAGVISGYYSTNLAPDTRLHDDVIENQCGRETGIKLYISNLDYAVSNDDLKEDGLKAMKKFHYVELDDKSMKIQIVQDPGVPPPRKEVISIETGFKLHVSNLHHKISRDDIKGIFSKFGHLKQWCLHYGMDGEPQGTAEVVFARRTDGVNAVNELKNQTFYGNRLQFKTDHHDISSGRGRESVMGHSRRGRDSGKGRMVWQKKN